MTISWIRRIISQDYGWSPSQNTMVLIIYGDLYIGKLKSTIKNISWIDFLKDLQINNLEIRLCIFEPRFAINQTSQTKIISGQSKVINDHICGV